jgi:AcrR family transcriptional regulator
MAQQERAQQTRDRLVDGAARAFHRLGYGLATTADIAREAGATRGALYFHFPSKEDLARAVIDKEQELSIAASGRILSLRRPPFETMLLLCVDLAERLRSDDIVKAGIRLTTEITQFDPPLLAPYEGWMSAFGGLAQQAVDTGEFRADLDAAAFARLLIPAYTGIQLVSDVFSGRADLMSRIRDLWLFLIPAVVAEDRVADARALVDSLIPPAS